MKKLTLLIAFGLGYVLGARAGRERYEQIKSTVDKVTSNPTVQQKTQQAVGAAKQQAPVVADKVTSAAGTVAGAAKDKVSGSSSAASSAPNREEHHLAGPQGDLP